MSTNFFLLMIVSCTSVHFKISKLYYCVLLTTRYLNQLSNFKCSLPLTPVTKTYSTKVMYHPRDIIVYSQLYFEEWPFPVRKTIKTNNIFDYLTNFYFYLQVGALFMHMIPNVTVIYCLCEILLLLESLDTHRLRVEFINLVRLGCKCIPYMFIYRLTMHISLM